jgi:hypothetical protein
LVRETFRGRIDFDSPDVVSRDGDCVNIGLQLNDESRAPLYIEESGDNSPDDLIAEFIRGAGFRLAAHGLSLYSLLVAP